MLTIQGQKVATGRPPAEIEQRVQARCELDQARKLLARVQKEVAEIDATLSSAGEAVSAKLPQRWVEFDFDRFSAEIGACKRKLEAALLVLARRG